MLTTYASESIFWFAPLKKKDFMSLKSQPKHCCIYFYNTMYCLPHSGNEIILIKYENKIYSLSLF